MSIFSTLTNDHHVQLIQHLLSYLDVEHMRIIQRLVEDHRQVKEPNTVMTKEKEKSNLLIVSIDGQKSEFNGFTPEDLPLIRLVLDDFERRSKINKLRKEYRYSEPHNNNNNEITV